MVIFDTSTVVYFLYIMSNFNCNKIQILYDEINRKIFTDFKLWCFILLHFQSRLLINHTCCLAKSEFPKLSANPYYFWEWDSQDPPLFPGLVETVFQFTTIYWSKSKLKRLLIACPKMTRDLHLPKCPEICFLENDYLTMQTSYLYLWKFRCPAAIVYQILQNVFFYRGYNTLQQVSTFLGIMAVALTGSFQIILLACILLIFMLCIFLKTVLNGPILYNQSDLSSKMFKCGSRCIILFILVYL